MNWTSIITGSSGGESRSNNNKSLGTANLLYDLSREIMSNSSTFSTGEMSGGGGGSSEEDMNMTDLLSDNTIGGGGEGSISWEEEFRDLSRFWAGRVLVPIVVFIGVLGNLVTIYILTRRPMRSSTNV